MEIEENTYTNFTIFMTSKLCYFALGNGILDDSKYKAVATKLSEIHNYVYRCNIYKILNRGKFLKADIINDVVSFLGYRHC